MAFRFGATTSDRVLATNGLSIGATTRVALVCGWWKPTTLTAGRALWSAGSSGLWSAEIDSTTDELILRGDHATTDSTATTSGVDLVVDTWTFLAFMVKSNNTGPLSSWTVWRGSPEVGPVEVTVTAGTAPVGNPAGQAAVYIGNKGTGTSAFQGDVADVAVLVSSETTTSTAPGTFGNQSGSTAPTAAEREFVLSRFVEPAWRGDWDRWRRGCSTVRNARVAGMACVLDGPAPAAIVWPASSAAGATGRAAYTVGGSAAVSPDRGPREGRLTGYPAGLVRR